MAEASQIKDLDKSYEQAINNLQQLTIDDKMIWVPGRESGRFVATKERNQDINIFQIAKKIEVGPTLSQAFEIVFFPTDESPKIAYAVSIVQPFPDAIARLHGAIVKAVDKQEAAFAKLFLEAAMPS